MRLLALSPHPHDTPVYVQLNAQAEDTCPGANGVWAPSPSPPCSFLRLTPFQIRLCSAQRPDGGHLHRGPGHKGTVLCIRMMNRLFMNPAIDLKRARAQLKC